MSNQATAHSVTFKRPDGAEVNGYLASPAVLEGAPAIVLIQEWWGLNEQIKGVAIRLAECGYRVLVPDLYRGASTVEEEEAHHLMDSLDFGDAVSQDIKGAVRYLQADSQKVGVTGYCMGGALTLLALNAIPELAAGVVWYGFPPLEYLDAAKIKAPLIGIGAHRMLFSTSKPSRSWSQRCTRQVWTRPSTVTWRAMPLPTKQRSATAVSPTRNTTPHGRNWRGTAR